MLEASALHLHACTSRVLGMSTVVTIPSTRIRRSFAPAVVAVSVAVAVVSCGTDTKVAGQTGVAIDSKGNVQLTVAMCRGRVTRLALFDGKHPSDRSSPDVPIGEWAILTPVTKSSTLSLAGPSDWAASRRPGPLEPGVSYAAFANDAKGMWAAGQVDFTLDQVKSLTSNQVLYHGGVVARADFRAKACAS